MLGEVRWCTYLFHAAVPGQTKKWMLQQTEQDWCRLHATLQGTVSFDQHHTLKQVLMLRILHLLYMVVLIRRQVNTCMHVSICVYLCNKSTNSKHTCTHTHTHTHPSSASDVQKALKSWSAWKTQQISALKECFPFSRKTNNNKINQTPLYKIPSKKNNPSKKTITKQKCTLLS